MNRKPSFQFLTSVVAAGITEDAAYVSAEGHGGRGAGCGGNLGQRRAKRLSTWARYLNKEHKDMSPHTCSPEILALEFLSPVTWQCDIWLGWQMSNMKVRRGGEVEEAFGNRLLVVRTTLFRSLT